MSPTAFMEVQELGPARLGEIAERMLAPAPAFEALIGPLEQEERSVFERYAGRYVQTGALKASLTSSGADGAVRRLTPAGLTFGSSIFYGRFQGTQGPGDHEPPSAILRATGAEGALAAKTLAEYVMHGGRL